MDRRERRRQLLNASVEQFLDYLEDQDEYSDSEMGVIVVAAEMPFYDDDEEERTGLPYWCSDNRRFVQIGFFNVLADQAKDD